MKMTRKRNLLPLRPGSVRPQLTCSSVSFFSAKERQKPLYDNQMVMTLDVLQDLTDNIIKELCHAISKPGGDGSGHQISQLSVTCLIVLGKAHVADFKRCR